MPAKAGLMRLCIERPGRAKPVIRTIKIVLNTGLPFRGYDSFYDYAGS